MLIKNSISLDELPAEPGSRILRAAEADAWQDGFRFLAAVREAASKTEENNRAAYAAAYEKGYADGRSAGALEASRIVRDTTLAVDHYLARLEQDIGALALSVVRRMFGDLDVTDLVGRAASQAVSELRHEKCLRVTVHPVALDRVHRALSSFKLSNQMPVTVESDPALDEGACIVASDFAVVDASIEVQLRALEAGLASGERDGVP